MEVVPNKDPKDVEIEALRAANDGLRTKIRTMEVESMHYMGKTGILLASKEKIISDLAAQLADSREHIANITATRAEEMKAALLKQQQG